MLIRATQATLQLEHPRQKSCRGWQRIGPCLVWALGCQGAKGPERRLHGYHSLGQPSNLKHAMGPCSLRDMLLRNKLPPNSVANINDSHFFSRDVCGSCVGEQLGQVAATQELLGSSSECAGPRHRIGRLDGLEGPLVRWATHMVGSLALAFPRGLRSSLCESLHSAGWVPVLVLLFITA